MATFIAKSKEINLLHPESQQIYRKLIESVQIGVYMADAKGKLFYVNEALVNILGYSKKDEVLGRNIDDELDMSPQEREEFLKKMEQVGFVRDYMVKVTRKDGSGAVFSVTSNFIKNDRDKIIGIEGMVQDVTEKIELDNNLKKEKAKLQEILNFDEVISTMKQLDDVVNYVVEHAIKILDARRCSLMLFDEEESELYVKAGIGIANKFLKNTRIKLGESISGKVAKEGKPVLVKNIEYDKEFERKNRSGYLTRSFMSVAMKSERKVIGVINVADKGAGETETFDETDLRILSTIAREASIAIQNARLYTELELLSITDPVTHLCNYRSFIQSLDYEVKRLQRYLGDLSLIMIDVDNFKPYNDTHGHPAGSKLLRIIGDILTDNLRSIDKVCRYGGDEFAVILPHTSAHQSEVVAEKLRKEVEEMLMHDKITLSIGIAGYKSHVSRNELIKRADEALYQAKGEGKNRICVYKHETKE